MSDPASRILSHGLGLMALAVFLYRTTTATLLAALQGLNSLRRRRLLEEGAIQHGPLAQLLEHPLRLRMTLYLSNQLLLVLLLGLLWPLRTAVPGGVWSLTALVLLYLWGLDLALPVFLTSGHPRPWLERLFPLYAPVHRALEPLVAGVATRIELKRDALDRARDEEDAEVQQEAVTALLEEGEAEGILQEEDRELIRNVVSFGDRVVREVMTPRTRMVAVPAEATVDEAWEAFAQSRHSRLPVRDGGIDRIVGVLLLKDVLCLPDGETKRAGELAKPPLFVPESKPVQELLRELQRARTHLAVVVDEFGGVSGLVTMEDLLEEIFGEILDEHESQTDIVDMGPGLFLVSGQTHVDDLGRRMGQDWVRDGFDTVAGMLMARLGRVPRVQESVEVEGARLTVIRMEGARITQVKVEQIPNSSAPGMMGPE